MPTDDPGFRTILLLLGASAIFAAAGLLAGGSPVVQRAWSRVRRSLARTVAVARAAQILGFVALPGAIVVMITRPAQATTWLDRHGAIVGGALVVLGIIAVVFSQAVEPRARRTRSAARHDVLAQTRRSKAA